MPNDLRPISFKFPRGEASRYFDDAGITAMTSACHPTARVMKLSRSRSPFSSNVTSSSTPGFSFAEILAPCSALANAFGSTLPIFSVTALTTYIAAVALHAVVVALVLVFLLELLRRRP